MKPAPFLALSILTPMLAAQGNVGLSTVAGPRNSTAFAPASLGNGITDVFQVGMIPHPNGSPGLYLGGMTVLGLSAALGGAGGFDVVAFTYDRGTDTVTLNANAASFNSINNEISLNWGTNGLYAVCDARTGVFQATTATAGGVLSAPTAVAGIGRTYVDPCPSQIGGQSVLFFDQTGGRLGWQPHDVGSSALTGAATITTAATGTNVAHSPWPIIGADGDAEALLGCEADSAFTVSDWNWQGDLVSGTTPVVEQPTLLLYESNGCLAGGRVYMCQSNGATSRVVEFDVVGALGDTVPSTGGPADLTAFSPAPNASGGDFTLVLNGFPGYLASPLALPGVNNLLGIDVLVITMLGVIGHNPTTGQGSISLPVPPMPSGTTITLQGLTLLGLTGPIHFTNTFAVLIQ